MKILVTGLENSCGKVVSKILAPNLKIEDHEKLCRIMQKQTHDKIHKLERQINRVESILLVSTGALISGMAYVIFALIIR